MCFSGATLQSFITISFINGVWYAVPMQVDERMASGRYVYTAGAFAGSDPDDRKLRVKSKSGSLSGRKEKLIPRYDTNDEFVFMLSDLIEPDNQFVMDSCPVLTEKTALLLTNKAGILLELPVDFFISNANPVGTINNSNDIKYSAHAGGWFPHVQSVKKTDKVYIISIENDKIPDSYHTPCIDYVQYIPEGDCFSSPYFSIGFSEKVSNKLFYRIAAGAWNDARAKSIINELTFFGAVSLFFNAITIRRNEDDAECRVAGWKDGPVRAIRAAEYALPIIGIINTPDLLLESTGYAQEFRSEVHLRVPIDVDLFVSDVAGGVGFDFSDAAGGTIIRFPGFTNQILLDQKQTIEENNFAALHPFQGYAEFINPEYTFFLNIDFPEDFPLRLHTLYQETNRPSRSSGLLGWNVLDMINIDHAEMKYTIRTRRVFK